MNLKRSVDNLAKKLDRFDFVAGSNNRTGLSIWKGKPIISLENWINIKDTHSALDYFPDDFDQVLTYISEDEKEEKQKREDVKKWNSNFIELMEYARNPKYGKMKCFRCSLSPAGDDPIFIGINRLVVKGLVNRKHDSQQYPCEVVNRFHCPYERTNIKEDDNPGAMNSNFDVEDLFKLEEMAFAIEISLAEARKEDSRIRIHNKEELLHALTDKETLAKILEQGSEACEVSDDIRSYLAENRDDILDYFMKLKDKVGLEELRFY